MSFVIEAIQYLRPNGRKKSISTSLSDDFQPAYEKMCDAGYRLELEVLSTGMVSATISNDEEDIAISLTKNNNEVNRGIEKMLLDKFGT